MIVAQTGLAARATWEGRRLHSAAHLIVLMALRHCRHAGLVLGRAVGRLPAYGAFGVCIQEVALSRRLVHDGRQGQEGDEGCPRGDAHLLSFRRCIRGRSRSDARPFFFRGMRPLSKTAVERSNISPQHSRLTAWLVMRAVRPFHQRLDQNNGRNGQKAGQTLTRLSDTDRKNDELSPLSGSHAVGAPGALHSRVHGIRWFCSSEPEGPQTRW